MSVYWAFLLKHLMGEVSRSLKATEWPVSKETGISLPSRLSAPSRIAAVFAFSLSPRVFHNSTHKVTECSQPTWSTLTKYTLVFRKHLLHQWKCSWAGWGGCAPGRSQHQSAQRPTHSDSVRAHAGDRRCSVPHSIPSDICEVFILFCVCGYKVIEHKITDTSHQIGNDLGADSTTDTGFHNFRRTATRPASGHFSPQAASKNHEVYWTSSFLGAII